MNADDFEMSDCGEFIVHRGSGTRLRLHCQNELGQWDLMLFLGPRHDEFDERVMASVAGDLLLQHARNGDRHEAA